MYTKLFLLAALASAASARTFEKCSTQSDCGEGLTCLAINEKAECVPSCVVPTTVTNTVFQPTTLPASTITSVEVQTTTLPPVTVTSTQTNVKTITVTTSAPAATSTAAVCEDVPVPGDAYGCASQASWGNCGASWMTGYCKKSCGTCPAPACEDKPVPDTCGCASQASWGNCAASWMTGYCQKSCGTCPGAKPPIQTYKTCKTPNTLAIAFDDGATVYQQSIIDQFNAVNGKTTFFTTGHLYQCIYNDGAVKSLRNAFASGHQIASHTWNHPDLTTLDATAQTTELTTLEDALQKIIGAKPTFIRPPYLASNAGLKDVLTSLDYRAIITNNVDSQDWNGYTAQQGYDAIVKGLEASQYSGIVLAHENYAATVNQLLPQLITYAQQKGIKLVTVAECIGDDVSKMYKDVGVQGERDGTWVC
ncbi:hypothetical protein HK097_000931 [Rhizophlyctis rosea]|uniref:Glycoside hydrolase/deacetylase n=1 Tax=Rhizophlyctis rosea TaxID=64517 RepID=A0AAD5SGB0_9FUNG|nr:hypothetical protein HK097_000931 [Rhizophlyctis rosea]